MWTTRSLDDRAQQHTTPRRKRVGPALVGLLLAASVAACGVAIAQAATVAPAPVAAPVITITNFTYTGDLTVPAGAMITVRNTDTAPHTLTAVDGSFTTPTIPAGGSVMLMAPTKPGSYAIKCNIHSSMSGTLVVTAAPTPSQTPSQTPSPTASPTASAPPANPVVTINNFAFSGDLTVRPGAIVTVRNMDTAPHTFTAMDGSFTTPVLQPGTSATITAPLKAGSYAVMCNIHSFMMTTLTVTAAPPPSTTPPSSSPTASPSPPTPPAANPVIVITNFTFTGDLRARPGARAMIRNDDTVPHTFTAVDGSFTTPMIPPHAGP